MLALEILNERLIDLERIFKMYQSTQVQMDINETKEAIDELEALQSRSCDGCKYYKKDNTTDCNGFTQDEECLRFIDEIHRIPCNDFCCNRYEAKEQ